MVMKNWDPSEVLDLSEVVELLLSCTLTVGVFSSIGHAQQAFFGMLQLEVLVGKFVAVDGFATRAIALGKVTTLNHEALDDPMEGRALIAETLLAGG